MTPTRDISQRLLVFLLILAWAVPASAQTRDLSDISIEDLAGISVQRVFGASDRLQPVTEAPSSVTIVTADEIARYGYRTLGDILASVRGFYITNDRNYSYVGARGFNRPGDYSTRVLLLVNGHRVNDNVYDQASVGAEFGIDVAMFDRVEIIRGPASSLYGTNALFAVVNVVTKTGAALNGVSVDADGGTLATGLARGSAGRRFANGMDLALSGTYEQSHGAAHLYQPVFDAPDTNAGLADDLDGEQSGQVYARFSAGNLIVSGAFGRRLKDVPTASFSTVFNAHDPAEHTADVRSMVSAQYVRVLGAARLTTEATLDNARYEGIYPYAGDEPQSADVVFRDGSSGLRWTLNSRITRRLPGRQVVTAGGEFIDNIHQNQWGGYAFDSASNFVLDQSSRQGAAYVQDEVKVRPWLLLNGGLRLDRFSRFSRTTPRGAVIVMPSANQSFKYLYGRAFRAPNAYELYYYRDGSAYLRPESIDTHEWVWEAYFGERVRTTVSTYRYTTSQLIDLQVLNPEVETLNGRLGFVNGGTIRAAGLELESEVRLKRGVHALASYALQEATDTAAGEPLTNSPRHQAKLRFSVPGPLDRSFASFEWQYLSRRTTITGSTVAPASVASLSAVFPLGRSVSVTAQLRDLFNARYADPASDEHLADSIEQNGRTIRVGLRWKLWTP